MMNITGCRRIEKTLRYGTAERGVAGIKIVHATYRPDRLGSRKRLAENHSRFCHGNIAEKYVGHQITDAVAVDIAERKAQRIIARIVVRAHDFVRGRHLAAAYGQSFNLHSAGGVDANTCVETGVKAAQGISVE